MTKSFERQLLGQMIASKYRIQEIQAAGAFGTVFQAHQYFCQEYVRPVAVKISRQTGLTEETAPVLFSDALMLARLLSSSEYHDGQRHLVQIFDMGLLPEHDHRAYLVMEYVDGQPLLSHLHAAGHLGVATGLRFVRQICRALALVHGQGAVHRDLKADNVLIDRRGVVRVVDFGLATYTDPELGFAPGSMGTFTYMAPETLMGRSTPASDVYSVGLLLYELFTGGGPHLTAPWSSEDRPGKQEEHYRIKTALPFRPPSEVHNEIRFDYRWLDALILRCLEIEPSRRFRDAGQLLAAIEACEAGKELPAVEPETEGTGAGVPVRARENPETVRDALFREVRRLLASRDYEEVIDKLDIHRPAEWAVIDLAGARTLRLLGQAYLGRGDLGEARDCLEQLRGAEKEKAQLPRADLAGALTDLFKCYRGLGQMDLARGCQEEARALMQG
jgi:serine/threonine protein kinase